MSDKLPILSDEWIAKVAEFEERMRKRYEEISHTSTPEVDGAGRKIIDKRPDGRDYIVEAYMREQLDRLFPGWSWRKAGGLTFLGSEWVVADGELMIIDTNLLAMGIYPPVRYFWGGDANRIQYRSGAAHTPDNIVDIGDNVQQAITGALKRATNRLTHIGDDVYRKRLDMEGAGTTEDYQASVLEMGGSEEKKKVFRQMAKKLGYTRPSDICDILQVKSLDQIEDYEKALKTLEEVKQK